MFIFDSLNHTSNDMGLFRPLVLCYTDYSLCDIDIFSVLLAVDFTVFFHNIVSIKCNKGFFFIYFSCYNSLIGYILHSW